MEYSLWTVILVSAFLWSRANGSDLASPVCVEESAGKDVDTHILGPNKVNQVENSRKCIVTCLKSKEPPCRAAVYQSGTCKIYAQSAKTTPGAFVDTQEEGVSYYEVMDRCPSPEEKAENAFGGVAQTHFSDPQENKQLDTEGQSISGISEGTGNGTASSSETVPGGSTTVASASSGTTQLSESTQSSNGNAATTVTVESASPSSPLSSSPSASVANPSSGSATTPTTTVESTSVASGMAFSPAANPSASTAGTTPTSGETSGVSLAPAPAEQDMNESTTPPSASPDQNGSIVESTSIPPTQAETTPVGASPGTSSVPAEVSLSQTTTTTAAAAASSAATSSAAVSSVNTSPPSADTESPPTTPAATETTTLGESDTGTSPPVKPPSEIPVTDKQSSSPASQAPSTSAQEMPVPSTSQPPEPSTSTTTKPETSGLDSKKAEQAVPVVASQPEVAVITTIAKPEVHIAPVTLKPDAYVFATPPPIDQTTRETYVPNTTPKPETYVPSGRPRPQPSQWSEWSPWANCVCAFGTGTKSRTRTCESPHPTCAGSSDENQPCDCPQPEWTTWTPWTACTVTCGGGTQNRNRNCSIPNYCAGAANEQRPCANVSCQTWETWQPWGACSVTCGSGVQLRTRHCNGQDTYGTGKNCIGSSSEQKTCKLPPCCTEWGPWEKCTVTCGTGAQTRKRECGDPADMVVEPIIMRGMNGQVIGTAGTRKRRQQPGNSDPFNPPQTEEQPCFLGDCPVWTPWAPFGPCTVTCGPGNKTRTRVCKNGKSDSDCPGPSKELVPCDSGPCPEWGTWETFSPCSVTCGMGNRTRTRSCKNGVDCKGSATETVPCEMGPCPTWTTWEQWTPCTVTCGMGKRTRIRHCQHGKDSDCKGEVSEMEPCNMGPCPIWCEWACWSPCTATCGPGTRKRKRLCGIPGSCPTAEECAPPPPPYVPHPPPPPPPVYVPPPPPPPPRVSYPSYVAPPRQSYNPPPQPYGESPVPSYGGGSGYNQKFSTREKRHTNDSYPEPGSCVGDSVITESCNPGPCPVWASWGPWGPCSTTCGPGTQTRTRTCTGGAGGSTCVGESKETKQCSQCQCPVWTEWGPWTSCTISCGYGTRMRMRECPSDCHPGSPHSYGRDRDGSYKGIDRGDSYGGGGDCPGEAKQMEKCGRSCATWTPWCDWSPCSADCGEGHQTRTRTCSGGSECPGDALDARPCDGHNCPTEAPSYGLVKPPPSSYGYEPAPYQPYQPPVTPPGYGSGYTRPAQPPPGYDQSYNGRFQDSD